MLSVDTCQAVDLGDLHDLRDRVRFRGDETAEDGHQCARRVVG